MRKFEKISYEQFEKDFTNFGDDEIYKALNIPKRGSQKAAGYDFYAPFAFSLEPREIYKMPTGIKVKMNDNEFLMIVVRSSVGFKNNVRMCNQVGIVDADYYNNEENEGHIWIAFQNEGTKTWVINQGDRVAQGIFTNYLTVNAEKKVSDIRKGGIGSTDKRRDNHE